MTQAPQLKASVLSRSGFTDYPAGAAVSLLQQLVEGSAFELAITPADENIDFPRMHVDWQAEGFVVLCFEDDRSLGFYPVTTLELSEPSVRIQLGGQALEEWPPELFVPLSVATRAVNTFVQTGRQEPSFGWIGNSDFKRGVIWETSAQRIAWENANPNRE